ncbi:uncharacterized protein LOC124641033 [Helicoverpa zea]|uniref:uncharacterized protein LOC124641033 n=1 Tax=Helicoverpa zea TaxID=7113 RepID=UPI001F57E956|nr:uncharacterized protein LOC124641033 [Helicoverpa zea]
MLHRRMKKLRTFLETNSIPIYVTGQDEIALEFTPQMIYIFLELYPSLVLISSSAIIVETIMYEVDRIKETLTTQILRCSDEGLRFELQTALQYVRLRPFRYTLCRAVPLDINLLFTTAALCITYVIVALQLTHFSAY